MQEGQRESPCIICELGAGLEEEWGARESFECVREALESGRRAACGRRGR